MSFSTDSTDPNEFCSAKKNILRALPDFFIRPIVNSCVYYNANMAPDEILLEAEEKMIKTEQVVANEFAGVRTGKASPSLVENIIVDVYGSQMRIRELAGITTPEPRMLVVQPWDMTGIQAIGKTL